MGRASAGGGSKPGHVCWRRIWLVHPLYTIVARRSDAMNVTHRAIQANYARVKDSHKTETINDAR